MARTSLAATFALTVLLGCGGARQPTNRFEIQSLNYLESAFDRMLGGRGYRLEEEITGVLGDDDSETHDIRLEGGRAYAILGACDDDCDDMDLFLVRDDGDDIDSDTSTDSFPIVRYTPRRNGDYRLRVRMYDCDTDPCYYAVGVYSRSR